jgi:hypothetical protein
MPREKEDQISRTEFNRQRSGGGWRTSTAILRTGGVAASTEAATVREKFATTLGCPASILAEFSKAAECPVHCS